MSNVQVLKSQIRPTTIKNKAALAVLKNAIWVYFFLLIFEGALRKWVLPSLSTPLLIVRDPVGIFILIYSLGSGLFPKSNGYLRASFFFGAIGIILAMAVGHRNLYVALFGARIFLIHFPLIFVMGHLFTREDVIKMGKVLIYISIPMTLLIAIQFYSPQSAFVNRGIGEDSNGAGFAGALGYFRPPGTFSFTNGNSAFYSFVSAFLFYFWLNQKFIKKIILIIATVAFIAAIGYSISRTIFFQAMVAILFVLIAVSFKPKYLPSFIIGAFFIGIMITALSSLSVVNKATEAFSSRFESANKREGGVEGVFLDRFLGGSLNALKQSPNYPFLGMGIGLGTAAGAVIQTGQATFLIDEGEWGRIVGEMGPLLGLLIIFMRCFLGIQLLRNSFNLLRKQDDSLSWMLMSYGFLIILQGGWAQPTNLGFFVIIGGMLLASVKKQQPGVSRSN
jgi:hypothetical protein